MIQDIGSRHLNNNYVNCMPDKEDTIFLFKGGTLLARWENEELVYPSLKEIERAAGEYEYRYLISIDDEKFFLAEKKEEVLQGTFQGEMMDAQVHKEYEQILPGYEFIGVNIFRKAAPKYRAFAAITAYHLYGWYRDNRFCGRCAKKLEHDHKERMLKCTCGNVIYPKICPAVIVGVTNGDKILLTKYAGRTYKNYALVAGFTEIGETLEQTVEREVLEEVGLKVKNITYYKSQPWALSGSILAGFFCEVDGDANISLDKEELSLGEWVSADAIDMEDEGISLTSEMISVFKKKKAGWR